MKTGTNGLFFCTKNKKPSRGFSRGTQHKGPTVTKMRVRTIIGNSGSAWISSDESVREFLRAHGLIEVASLGLPGITTRPHPNDEFFIYYREKQEGITGSKFSLVRADGYRGNSMDSGIITERYPAVHGTQMFEARGSRLLSWVFFCEPAPLDGNAQDFRFFLGSEVGH